MPWRFEEEVRLVDDWPTKRCRTGRKLFHELLIVGIGPFVVELLQVGLRVFSQL